MMKTKPSGKSPLLSFVITTAKKAGELILKESSKKLHISKKGKNNLVTHADKASEKLIVSTIKKAYPKHAILAEEASFKETGSGKIVSPEKFAKSEYIWLVDPLDGTTNFAHGLYQYCVSIALFKNTTQEKSTKQRNSHFLEGEIILGVVFAPVLNQLFYAEKGKGAHFQDTFTKTISHKANKIHVSKTKKVSESLMVTGFPTDHREKSVKHFIKMIYKCQAVRRLGSAALDLCYTAAGYFDGYWEFGLKPWDIAAGALIVNEAGGKVTDTKGNLLDLYGQDILASNGKVHKEMIKIFGKI